MRDFLALAGFALFLFVLAYGIYINARCHDACGSDRINRCYEDRAVCVSTDKLYVRQIR